MELQTQKVSENSLAIQANGNVTINDYLQIKEICTDLYKLNFPTLVQEASDKAKENLKLYVDTFGVPKGFENIVAIARENEIKNLIFFEIKNKGTSILKKNLKILIDEKIKEMKLDEKNNKNTFDGWLK